jgi:hypothetical protein|tara:strand:+ start:911 stop:1177 length:267 start_codon:yes stop_codon:yes gene_type:complete
MKFFITLIILFNGEVTPKIFTYQFIDFTEYKVCEVFINEKKNLLKQTIEHQFSNDKVHSSMVACMTDKEVENLRQQTQGKKWQQQEHI